MDSYDYVAANGQDAGIPVVFVPEPNAYKSPEAIAESLAINVLRDEFLQEIHI